MKCLPRNRTLARPVQALLVTFALLTGGALALARQSASAAVKPALEASASQNPQKPAPVAPPIRVTTGLVNLIVTVVDKHQHFVTDLNRSDFKVYDDGVPQDIRFFGRETNLPLRIALLLDTSNSIRPRLQFEKGAAIDFFADVIRRDRDMAFLMTFDNEPEVVQKFTNEVYLLNAAVREQSAGGGTALNDAIVKASQLLEHAPLPKKGSPEVRRVIVLISDGNDDLSDHALSDAINAAIRSEAVIYTISTNTKWISLDDESKPTKYFLTPGDKILKRFAVQTGGRTFFPYSVDDLAESFANIGTELRSQYYIAYRPSKRPVNGQYHRIKVTTDRKGLIVRTRKGYFAVAPTSSSPADGR